MRHPTLALIVLAFAAGSLLHCELGVPASAEGGRTISSGCEPIGPYDELVADIRDSRIRPETVGAVYVCSLRCETEDECGCPWFVECHEEGPHEWCITPAQYGVTHGRLVAPCGSPSTRERYVKMVLR